MNLKSWLVDLNSYLVLHFSTFSALPKAFHSICYVHMEHDEKRYENDFPVMTTCLAWFHMAEQFWLFTSYIPQLRLTLTHVNLKLFLLVLYFCVFLFFCVCIWFCPCVFVNFSFIFVYVCVHDLKNAFGSMYISLFSKMCVSVPILTVANIDR